MIIMYEKAKALATKAHEGQTRWDPNIPYITHPLAIADQFMNPIYKAVAVLHDVVEDTDITLEFLKAQFPEEVVDAVDAITKRDGETYDKYILRCASNNVAAAVKIKDIKYNTADLPEDGKKITRIRKERYALALYILENSRIFNQAPGY
jgi:(p)ppGpp synthase/HD superfamily hydrolase